MGIDRSKVPDELLGKLKGLYTAAISDALDIMGIRNQVMRSDIRPIYPEAVVVGRAFTTQALDVAEIPREPFKYQIEAIDKLKPDDVVVAAVNETGESAYWGELTSAAAKYRGSTGCIVDGYIRDVKMIVRTQFPVFAKGYTPADAQGRAEVILYDISIKCGGVIVNPGDIIFADFDGIVVIPQDIAPEVIKRAEKKVKGEDTTREELQQGVSLGKVFKKYGIL